MKGGPNKSIGEGAKVGRWKDGSVCNSISTSSMPHWAHCCKGKLSYYLAWIPLVFWKGVNLGAQRVEFLKALWR